jgi:hypothetical protein
MRLQFAVTLAALVMLAGCGDGVPFTGDARAAYDRCIVGDGTAARCTCVTKILQEKLSPDAFSRMAKGEVGDDLEATLVEISAADQACTEK